VDRVANWHCMLHAMVRDPNFSSLTPYLSLGVYYVTDARESAVFAAQRLISAPVVLCRLLPKDRMEPSACLRCRRIQVVKPSSKDEQKKEEAIRHSSPDVRSLF
jgi:hypothetical protein